MHQQARQTGCLQALGKGDADILGPPEGGVIKTMNTVHANAPEAAKVGKAAKKNVVPMIWRVLGMAQKVYEVQLNKSPEVKLSCLMRFMPAKYHDPNTFWKEYAEHINLLIDSRKFCKACKERELDPKVVAEHIVFYGSAAIKKVLREGLEKYIGRGVDEYQNRFTPKDIDSYIEEVDDNAVLPKYDDQIEDGGEEEIADPQMVD